MSTKTHPQIPEDTYHALMEATYRALCNHGYTNLRVRDIDEEFEKSRQLINHYYDGKDELISAVLDYLLEEYEARIELPEQADPETRLAAYIDQFLYGPTIEGFDHWELLMAINELRSQAHHNEEHRAMLEERTQWIIDSMSEIIAEGIEQGVFRPVDPERTANTINDIIDGARQRKITFEDEKALDEARRALDEFIFPRLRAS